MKVNDPVITATQPDPVNTLRVIDNVNVAVFSFDINRPKRPDVWVSVMQGDNGNWGVQVQCTRSEYTPYSQRDEKVMLEFEVTGCENLQVIQDSARYTVNLVFVDRGSAE